MERYFRTVRARFLPRLNEGDLQSLESLSERFEHWLREDYHLRRHGGIDQKPLDRFLAGAEQILVQRLSTDEIDHAFMARITRVVRQDATVKIDSAFYEVPSELVGARVDIRYPVADPKNLILYRDDKPVGPVRPVDLADNARFHTRTVDTSYSDFVERPGPDPDDPDGALTS